MLTKRLVDRILQGPPRSTDPLVDDDWPSVVLDGPHGPYRVYLRQHDSSAPLVVAVHGWTSGTAHARNRTAHLYDAGFNVVLLEMLSHGTSNYDGHFTAQCIVDCLDHLIDHLESELLGFTLEHDIILHGHSLGAYVVIRSASGRHRRRFRALLLESPMTCYSPILEEHLRVPPLLRKFVVRRLMAKWNSMHPDLAINELSEVDVPVWGCPSVPTFVMQADPDTRLGSKHLEALVESVPDSLMTIWRSTTLRHSGTSRHEERDLALMAWLKELDFIPRC